MTLLDYFYDLDFSKIDFQERKQSISNKNTIIYGGSKSGKSYLVYDYLSNFDPDEYLYIDFNHLKINNLSFYNNVQTFIEEHNIKVLALDNFDINLPLPKCDSIIITTNQQYYLNNFETIKLSATDFEEFLLFDKHQNITTSFNYFLKYGNLIQTIILDELHKSIQLRNHIRLLANDKTELFILKNIIKNCGEVKSANQLYLLLKKEIKLSKDRFYKYFQDLEDQGIISFLAKYNHKKAAKKLFCYNHALIDQVNIKKQFNNIFTNMIYLELINDHDEIYYDDHIDFYIPSQNKIVLAIPFFIGMQISPKVLAFIEENNIKKITIVTVSNEQDIYLDGVECEVNPFYVWAVE